MERKSIFLRLLTQIKYKAAFFSFYFFFLYSTSLYFFHRRGEFYIVHDHIGPFLLFLLWIGFNIFHALFRDLFFSFILIFFVLATLMIFLFYLRKLRISLGVARILSICFCPHTQHAYNLKVLVGRFCICVALCNVTY